MELKDQTKLIQQTLKDRGFYTGSVDGYYGPLLAEAAMTALGLADEVAERGPYTQYDYAWTAKFSPEFRDSILWTVKELQIGDGGLEGASMLASCMAFETGETFDPAKRNPKSTATGLIQFMEFTAKNLGTTTAELAKMTQVQQMNYVYKYFLPHKGKLKDLSDIYMAILWPAGIGKPLDHVLWSKNDPKTESAYNVNSGLDLDKSGTVTKAEAYAKVKAKYDRGMLNQFRRKI